jgi:hypothetical protein
MNAISRLFAIAVLLASGAAFAQVENGTIVGTVADATNALIPHATVLIKNQDTGATVNLSTNEAGQFSSPPLRPGAYVVSTEAVGFRRTEQTLRLDVSQQAKLAFKLTVGSVDEVISVTAEAPLIESQSAALGNVRTTQAINDLPLNGRNFVQLFYLATGVVNPVSGSSNSNQAGAIYGSVNGARIYNNDYRYDGIQSMDSDNAVLIFIPSPDAIQEFKVQTSAMDASFGRAGGGTINLVIKSGTNKLHGTAFEFLRNSAMDAKNFFDLPTGPTPPFKLNQFGGSIGGPVKRDRTFFFADYQGSRVRQAQTYISTVPTPAMTGGNFQTLGLTMYDPATTRTNPANPAGLVRDPFPDNIIPVARFNQTGKNLVALYPVPNLPGIKSNYLNNPSRAATTDQMDVRVDHRLRDVDQLFARYSYSLLRAYNPGYLPYPAVGAGPGYPGTNRAMGEQAVAGYVHTFSPTLIYEFRTGYSRLDITNPGLTAGTNLASKIGIPGINNDPAITGLGALAINGFASLGDAQFNPVLKISNNYQYTNRLSWFRGRHSLKFGYEILRRQLNQYAPQNGMGYFTFNGAFTQNPAKASGTGTGLADVLLGLDTSGQLDYDNHVGLRKWEHSLYVADDIRVTSNLTLNVGVRYDISIPFTEVNNLMGNFVPALRDVFRVGSQQLPDPHIMATHYKDFGPRFGLAYSLNSKTVIRSGYGIFYSFPAFAGGRFPTKTPPVAGNVVYNNDTYATNLSLVTPISAGFPLVRPTVFTTTGSAFKSYAYNDPDSMVQQWNINIQRELVGGTVLTVGYAGSHGSHLYIFPNINQALPGPGAIASRRPYPNLADSDGLYREADSIYHGLQMTAEKRLAKGLSFLASFSYSHAIDLSSNDLGGAPMNDYNIRVDRGNADFDVRQNLVLSWGYELPVGRGRKFGSDFHGVAQSILGGWQINGIQTFHTGLYFSPSAAQNTIGSGVGAERPNVVGTPNLPSSQRTLQRWFDPSAFATPATYIWGNSGRNVLVGPGTKQFDLSTFKNFPWGRKEAQMLQFRAEFFNVLNTPQFNNPNASIGNASAGVISAAGEKTFFQRTSRQIQMALKFYF